MTGLAVQLSPHFTLAEMCATRQPFPNVPGAVAVDALRYLCGHVLEPVRAHFGPVTVNSGYRSLKVNAAVGSKPTSQHVRGEAADIEVAGVPNAVLAQWIKDNLAGRYDQLILEAYRPGVPGSGWVHVSTFDTAQPMNAKIRRWLRGSVLTMTMGSHGPTYQKGLRV